MGEEDRRKGEGRKERGVGGSFFLLGYFIREGVKSIGGSVPERRRVFLRQLSFSADGQKHPLPFSFWPPSSRDLFPSD